MSARGIAGGTEDQGRAGEKAEPDGAEGVEGRSAAEGQDVHGTGRVMTDQGGAEGGRSPGGADGLMGEGGVTGSEAGGRAMGSHCQDRAGNHKTQGRSTQKSGFNKGGAEGLKETSRGEAEGLAVFNRGGGKGRLGGTTGEGRLFHFLI